MKTKLFVPILALCILLAACAGKYRTDPSDPGNIGIQSPSTSEPAPTDEPTIGSTTSPTSETGNRGTEEPVVGPIQTSGLVPESAAVDKSYFDDAAFVGDSVSLKLSYYQAATKALGEAQFFASGSLSAGNSLWEISDKSVHPSYQGTKMLVEDCIQKSGAKKVYIMLGMNDIGLYGLEGSIENYKTLIARIKEKSPDVIIFIESMTPMASTSNLSGSSLNNTNIRKYNIMLLETCEEMGWYFVDVGSVMYDDDGTYLRPSYCSDLDGMAIHFTNEGCERWVEYLLTHTIDFS